MYSHLQWSPRLKGCQQKVKATFENDAASNHSNGNTMCMKRKEDNIDKSDAQGVSAGCKEQSLCSKRDIKRRIFTASVVSSANKGYQARPVGPIFIHLSQTKLPKHHRSELSLTPTKSMATKKRKILSISILLLVFLTGAPTSESFSYSQYRTLFSLAHSLLTRVANLRASRGDFEGANRARIMAVKLERAAGLGLWRFMWSAGWDYLRNYAWRDFAYSDMISVVSDANELLSYLGELNRAESDSERVAWVGRNYQTVLRVSRSLLARLLKVFRQSGTLRGVLETVQREVVDGGLLRDCLELGSNDLKGLIQILKDLGSQYVSTSDKSHADL